MNETVRKILNDSYGIYEDNNIWYQVNESDEASEISLESLLEYVNYICENIESFGYSAKDVAKVQKKLGKEVKKAAKKANKQSKKAKSKKKDNEEEYSKEEYNFDSEAYNSDEYNQDQYAQDDYNQDGYGQDGYDQEAYNQDGYNSEEYYSEAYNQDDMTSQTSDQEYEYDYSTSNLEDEQVANVENDQSAFETSQQYDDQNASDYYEQESVPYVDVENSSSTMNENHESYPTQQDTAQTAYDQYDYAQKTSYDVVNEPTAFSAKQQMPYTNKYEKETSPRMSFDTSYNTHVEKDHKPSHCCCNHSKKDMTNYNERFRSNSELYDLVRGIVQNEMHNASTNARNDEFYKLFKDEKEKLEHNNTPEPFKYESIAEIITQIKEKIEKIKQLN